MIGLGFDPKWRRDDMPWMPKGRYRIMRDYMPKKGQLGLDMMLRTCTVQANLDFQSEADMVKKFRVSLALQPVAIALFANSPFVEGRPSGFLQLSQPHLDRHRPRPLRHAALRVRGRASASSAMSTTCSMCRCISSIATASTSMPAASRSAISWPGKLPALPGELPLHRRLGRPPDHRVPRGAAEDVSRDARRRRRPVAAALRAAGVLGRAALRSRPRSMRPGTWSPTGPRRSARRCGATCRGSGLDTPHRSRTLRDIALEILEIAREGLHRRARRDARGEDETHFLDPLFAIAGSGRTPAAELVEDYRTRWGGDIDPHLHRAGVLSFAAFSGRAAHRLHCRPASFETRRGFTAALLRMRNDFAGISNRPSS